MASTIAQASIARPVAVSAGQTKASRAAATVVAVPVASSVSSAFIGTPVRAAMSAARRTAVSTAVVSKAVAAPAQDWDKMAAELDTASPLQIMDEALKAFGDDIAIAFSGAEDVALIEYAKLTGRKFRVFSLDTGRLNAETYQLFDAVEKHYGIRIEYTFPDTQECLDLVNAKGMFSFYEDGHQECCRVRKVRPLRRKLGTLNAWITGQRKDQSPGTRSEIPISQVDPVFEGLAGGEGSLVKFNPLANVTSSDVWTFLRTMEVPVNSLHDKGFISIGCEPCTRPVLPNQHEREGRWWWEDATAKECGLHSGNIKESAEGEAEAAEDLWTSGVTALSKDDLEKMVAAESREKDTVAVLYAPWCQFCQGLEPDYAALAESLSGNDKIEVAKFQADIQRDFAAATFGLETYPTIVLLPKTGGVVKYPSERRDVETLQGWVRAMCGSA